jgi:hypothetical protein
MNERMNIRRMQTLEPGREKSPFDPDRDIPPEQWKRMEDALEVARRESIGADLIDLLWGLAVLRPSKTYMVETDKAILLEQVEHLQNINAPIVRLIAMSRIHMTDSEFSLPINTKEFISEMQTELARMRTENKWSAVCTILVHAKALGYADQLHPWGDDWQHILEEVEKYRKSNLAWILTDIAADIKLLDPEKATVHDSDWKRMKGHLQFLMGKKDDVRVAGIALEAAWLKIIAADEVRMTEKGLEFSARSKLTQENVRSQPDTLSI